MELDYGPMGDNITIAVTSPTLTIERVKNGEMIWRGQILSDLMIDIVDLIEAAQSDQL